jgi:hypothetical protein
MQLPLANPEETPRTSIMETRNGDMDSTYQGETRAPKYTIKQASPIFREHVVDVKKVCNCTEEEVDLSDETEQQEKDITLGQQLGGK